MIKIKTKKGNIEEIKTLIIDYPYDSVEFTEAINLLLTNLHKTSAEKIRKLVE